MSVHVYSSATVVSETGALDYPRIGYANLARDATATASTEAANYPADAAQRPDTFEGWQPTVLSAWWQVDLTTAQTVNYVGIAAHDLGTKGCTVKAQYSSDGASWSDASDTHTPSDDSAILILFPQQSARYWRILIDGAGSPTTTDMPTIGVVYAGEIMVMERQLYGGHAPITLNRETILYQALSRGGQFLGQSFRRNGFSTSAAFKNLSASWVRSTFDAFVQAARQYPYFFAWRSGTWANEVAYVWTDKDILPKNQGVADRVSVAWPMRGFSDE